MDALQCDPGHIGKRGGTERKDRLRGEEWELSRDPPPHAALHPESIVMVASTSTSPAAVPSIAARSPSQWDR
jgi:hypothetical protein